MDQRIERSLALFARDILSAVQRPYQLFLTGSFAKGAVDECSDVDLCLVISSDDASRWVAVLGDTCELHLDRAFLGFSGFLFRNDEFFVDVKLSSGSNINELWDQFCTGSVETLYAQEIFWALAQPPLLCEEPSKTLLDADVASRIPDHVIQNVRKRFLSALQPRRLAKFHYRRTFMLIANELLRIYSLGSALEANLSGSFYAGMYARYKTHTPEHGQLKILLDLIDSLDKQAGTSACSITSKICDVANELYEAHPVRDHYMP